MSLLNRLRHQAPTSRVLLRIVVGAIVAFCGGVHIGDALPGGGTMLTMAVEAVAIAN